MTDWAAHALDALHRRGHREGGARRAVVELLGEQRCCLTAQEIFDRVRATGRRVGLASVYRILDLLVQLRLVQRLDVGDGIARYEPLHPDGHHHHHVVCDDCGRVEAFSDPTLETAIGAVAGRVGFTIEAHEVVLHGACDDCEPERSSSVPRRGAHA